MPQLLGPALKSASVASTPAPSFSAAYSPFRSVTLRRCPTIRKHSETESTEDTMNSGESNRPLTPILSKSIAIRLPFLPRYFGKSMPSSWQKVVYTPPVCITIRLPFVSRYFCRSIRVRGCWTHFHELLCQGKTSGGYSPATLMLSLWLFLRQPGPCVHSTLTINPILGGELQPPWPLTGVIRALRARNPRKVEKKVEKSRKKVEKVEKRLFLTRF